MPFMALDPASWGNAAEWLAAVGTVATLGFALGALRIEVQARKAEDAARRADEARLRASQARRVAFVASARAEGSFDPKTGTYVPPWALHYTGEVTNLSDEPIYTVNITVALMSTRHAEASAVELLPGKAISCQGRSADHESNEIPAWLVRQVTFTDASGVAWLAQPGGRLRELDLSDTPTESSRD